MRKPTPCIDCNKPSYGVRCRSCMILYRRENATSRREGYQRFWYIKKKYNMSEDEFWAYWTANHGKCYICVKQMEMPKKQRGQNLDSCCIDHDHQTGKVRGLLCSGCNKGIGLLGDDPKIIRQALEYLSV